MIENQSLFYPLPEKTACVLGKRFRKKKEITLPSKNNKILPSKNFKPCFTQLEGKKSPNTWGQCYYQDVVS